MALFLMPFNGFIQGFYRPVSLGEFIGKFIGIFIGKALGNRWDWRWDSSSYLDSLGAFFHFLYNFYISFT